MMFKVEFLNIGMTKIRINESIEINFGEHGEEDCRKFLALLVIEWVKAFNP